MASNSQLKQITLALSDILVRIETSTQELKDENKELRNEIKELRKTAVEQNLRIRELEGRVTVRQLDPLLNAEDMQLILGKGKSAVSQLMNREDFADACVEKHLGTPYVVTHRFYNWLDRNDKGESNEINFNNVRQLRRKGIG